MKTILISFLINTIAFASEHGGESHEAHGIPTIVYWQLANVLVLGIALFIMLRKPAIQFFISRKQEFVNLSEKSKKTQEEAEKSYLALKHKLEYLSSSSDESYAKAKVEAEELKKSIIADAVLMAKKIEQEAQFNMKNDIEKAKQKLKVTAVLNAMKDAKGLLQKDVPQNEYKGLQDKFVTSLKDVQI